MSWPTILLSFFNALLGAGLANIGFQWWREHYGSRRNVAWLALQLAVLLERFGGRCISSSHYDPDDEEMHFAMTGTKLGPPRFPSLPEYPKDEAAWRLLDLGVANDLLVFPDAVRVWQGSSDMEVEDVGPSEAGDTFRRGCVSLARRSLTLALTLRQQHGLRPQAAHLLPAVEERSRAIHKEDATNEENFALAMAAKQATERMRRGDFPRRPPDGAGVHGE